MAIRKASTPRPARPARRRKPAPGKPIWERIADIGRSVPDEVWERVPTDAARNFDHYLDGSPKQD